jgi:hypothetical protein
MTDAAEVAAGPEETAAAIWRGVAWCTAAQSGITALAALLPGSRHLRSRSRRALAYATLAAFTANHVMFASGIALVVTTAGADSSGPWYWIIGGAASVVVMLAAGDLVCFLASSAGWINYAMVPILTDHFSAVHPPWIRFLCAVRLDL